MQPNRTFFPALTGLRAVAATLIFLHHYLANHPRLPVLLNLLVTKMFVGLTLFFVLTGFLIAFRYFPAANLSGSYLKRYYKNRFVRVYPLFFLLTVIILVAQKESNWQVWLVNLTTAKGFFNDYKFTGLAQAWSLTVIEVFYLCAPLLYIWLKKGKSLWLLLVPAYITGAGLVLLSQWLSLGSFFENMKFMFIYTVFGQAFAFLFGMWCFQILEKVRKLVKPLQGWLTYGSVAAFLAFLIGWSLLAKQLPMFRPHGPGGIVLTNIVAVIFCGAIILALITEETYLSRLLSWDPIVRLGKSSYAFYLLNMGFFATLFYEHVSNNPVLIFLASAAAAYVVHVYFEVPLLRRYGGSRFLKPAGS